MSSWGRRGAVFVAALATAVVPALADLDLETTLLTSDVSFPLAVVSAHDSSGRLFLVQQTGQIRLWDGDEVLEDDFLDISGGDFAGGGERGLLGLAFHPNYPTDGRFFVYYTAGDGDLVISSFSVSGDPDIAEASSESVLLRIEHSAESNHNGGNLAFGPDGYLYAGVGDGGGGGDPFGNGQDPDTLLGALLRLDIDVDPNDYLPGPVPEYEIPAGNPFAAGPGADEVWDYGLRNPWRWSFDRETGDLWIGDVGQNSIEEIDLEPAPSPGGVNWGWNVMEGDECYPPGANCTETGTLPVLTYEQSSGRCSVTGGFRYRGSAHPRLRGSYLYGDYCTGEIWATTQRCDGVWDSGLVLDTPFNVSSFGEDEDGELLISHLGGAVYRLGLAGTATGAAVEVTPASRHFGAIAANTLATQEILLQNTNFGDEAAVVVDIAMLAGPPFAVDPSGGADPCGSLTPCLAPGESCTVLAELSSASGGSFGDTLEVSGNFVAASAALQGVVYASCGLDGVSLTLDAAVTIQTFSACEDITASAGFVVEAGGDVTLRAGNLVAFEDGTSVVGALSVEVDPLIALE